MKRIQQTAGNITGIHSQLLELEESFIDMAARFADQPGTVVLMSGGDLDCARYHMLGLWPWLSFKGKNRAMRVTAFDREIRMEQAPFDTLREIINVF